MKSKEPLICLPCLALVIAAALVCCKAQIIAVVYGKPRGILAELTADAPRAATTIRGFTSGNGMCHIHLPWTSTVDESSALAKAMGRARRSAWAIGSGPCESETGSTRRGSTLRRRLGGADDCPPGRFRARERAVVLVIRGMMIE